jgi:hypothetical protein
MKNRYGRKKNYALAMRKLGMSPPEDTGKSKRNVPMVCAMPEQKKADADTNIGQADSMQMWRRLLPKSRRK